MQNADPIPPSAGRSETTCTECLHGPHAPRQCAYCKCMWGLAASTPETPREAGTRKFRDLVAETMTPESIARADAETARLLAPAPTEGARYTIVDTISGPAAPTTEGPRDSLTELCERLTATGARLDVNPEGLAAIVAECDRALAASPGPGAPEGTTLDTRFALLDDYYRLAHEADNQEQRTGARNEIDGIKQEIAEAFAALTSEVALHAEALAAVQANERTYWDRALAAEAEVARLTEELRMAEVKLDGTARTLGTTSMALAQAQNALASRDGSHTETETKDTATDLG